MEHYTDRLTDEGKAAVVRNGYQPEREILTGIGSVPVKIPKVRAKDGKPVTFHSALVPPYVRKAKSLEASLLWIPFFGWGLKALDPVTIDRKTGRKAIVQVVQQGIDRLNKGI